MGVRAFASVSPHVCGYVRVCMCVCVCACVCAGDDNYLNACRLTIARERVRHCDIETVFVSMCRTHARWDVCVILFG